MPKNEYMFDPYLGYYIRSAFLLQSATSAVKLASVIGNWAWIQKFVLLTNLLSVRSGKRVKWFSSFNQMMMTYLQLIS